VKVTTKGLSNPRTRTIDGVEYTVGGASGTRGGFWRSHRDMARPFVAFIDGKPLLSKTGQPCRYSTPGAAFLAAKKEHEKCQRVQRLQEVEKAVESLVKRRQWSPCP